MFWKVEYIGDQANILIEDPAKPQDEWEPVGMGMPIKFAERIVKLHNDDLLALPQNTYEGMLAIVKDQPMTWYPKLITEMVKAAYAKKVFKTGGASCLIQMAVEKDLGRNGGAVTPGVDLPVDPQ